MGEPQSDRFEQTLVVSVAVHIAVFLAFTVKAYIFPSEPIAIQSAIRVDVVGLPDKAEPKKPRPSPKAQPKPPPKANPPKKPQPKPVVKTTQKKPRSSVDLKSAKSKQQQALERLKAMQALESLKQEVAKQDEQKNQQTSPPPQEPDTEFKGNVITSGSSLTGLDRIDFEKYYEGMSNHVKAHWSLPGWLAAANLRAEAAVTIDERGFVTSKRIYSSSGNQVFDDLVLQTVEKASPLPAPPSRLKSVLALKGMILGFPD